MTDGSDAREVARHDAVLLAGGRAARLGGIDKTALRSDGETLFRHAVAAAAHADRLVVVGLRDEAAAPPGALVVREDPPFSGPVAAVAAGLDAIGTGAPLTLVLACDLVRPEEASALLLDAADSQGTGDGVVAVDPDGRRQPLLAVYRSTALRTAARSLSGADAGLIGRSMRQLLAPLDLVEVPLPAALCADVDLPEDAAGLT